MEDQNKIIIYSISGVVILLVAGFGVKKYNSHRQHNNTFMQGVQQGARDKNM